MTCQYEPPHNLHGAWVGSTPKIQCDLLYHLYELNQGKCNVKITVFGSSVSTVMAKLEWTPS